MNPTGGNSKEPGPTREPSPAVALTVGTLAVGSSSERRRLPALLSATGLAVIGAAASVVAAPGLAGIAGAGLALLMMAIAITDSRYFVIPDELNAAAMVLALVNAAASGDMPVAAVAVALLRGAALASVFFGIRTAYRMARGRDGIGLGDVKLAAVAGAWLGWTIMPVAVEAAAVSALAIHLARHVLHGQPIRRTNRLPFGLFFAPAVWLGWLMQTSFLSSLWGY